MWYISLIIIEIYHISRESIMTVRKFLYGATGFLSLIGVIGVLGNEKGFLPFFVFAVNFEYWFMKQDEMLDDYMNKSASRGFYCGMIATACITLYLFLINKSSGNEAFTNRLALGWAIAVIVYSISTAYFGIKEKWGICND